MGTDYGLTAAVDLTAAALATVLADGTIAGEVAHVYQPGADLSAVPGVGIEPAIPFADFRTIGARCLTVAWRMRLLLGRWESSASIALSIETYRAAAPALRRAGFGVGQLEAPSVATVAGQPTLLAAFPVTYTAKD